MTCHNQNLDWKEKKKRKKKGVSIRKVQAGLGQGEIVKPSAGLSRQY